MLTCVTKKTEKTKKNKSILEWSVAGIRMGKSEPLEGARLANQIQGFKISDNWEAGEKNNKKYW